MYDAGKIVAGLLVFVAVCTAPVWYNAATGQAAERPVLEKPVGETKCVEDAATMRALHMDVLHSWREEVVRGDQREYITADGRRFPKSLTATCLKCHTHKKEFCDKCHVYVGVGEPSCWQCHHAEVK
jgi:hypothetical protein